MILGRDALREAIKVLEIYGVVVRTPRLGTVDGLISTTSSVLPLPALMELGKGACGSQVSVEQHTKDAVALYPRDVAAYPRILEEHMELALPYIVAAHKAGHHDSGNGES